MNTDVGMGSVKTAKRELLEMLDRMPDDSSMDELLHSVYFVASVRRGLAQIERGEGISHDEVLARLAAWLESSGRRKLSET